MSSSLVSNRAATGSSKRPTARRPCAAARPWQTRTAVLLAEVTLTPPIFPSDRPPRRQVHGRRSVALADAVHDRRSCAGAGLLLPSHDPGVVARLESGSDLPRRPDPRWHLNPRPICSASSTL